MAVYKVLYRLVMDKRMYYESGALYLANMYGYECGAAKKLVSLLTAKQEVQDITFLLAEAQKELGISLSPKQEEGVRKAFCHPVSIWPLSSEILEQKTALRTEQRTLSVQQNSRQRKSKTKAQQR